MNHRVRVVSVFASGPDGGNPAPIVVDAAGMTDADMQQVARSHGHESGFVFPAPAGSGCDFEFRFWVPNHEMSMCGHATVGALWLLERLGRLPGDSYTILTRSGRVEAKVGERAEQGAAHGAEQGARIEISQPLGHVDPLPDADSSRAAIVDVLGLNADDLLPLPVQNAATSRVKTLVPLKSVATLDRLTPDFSRIEALCERIGSTGLYPYAVSDPGAQVVDARQFPSSSGYPEDAATGIAASALAFGLLSNGMVEASQRRIAIRQGRAMQRPSEISVRFRLDQGRPAGCWLGGAVRMAQHEPGDLS